LTWFDGNKTKAKYYIREDIKMIPEFEEMMLPFLKVLGDGKEHSLKDCIDELSREFKLTEEEKKELLPSGKITKFNNRFGWAKTHLAKAGLIETTTRGYVKITERGKLVLQKSPEKLDNKYLMKFEEFREFLGVSKEKQVNETKIEEAETPEEIIENQFEILKKNLKDQLMDKVTQSSPQFFEILVIDLIVKMGYGGSFEEVAQHLGKTGDEGID